ncbi:MAG TPA: RidA family protein [Jatrophihabitans sp.]|jgi:enamine deaminase RidA (YjgF/YER057c/UK114 family)|uniref:RidA family protein n=1 Tax=Jatrophihabitans sp. TaxID=1932789 RepID=UPI002EF605A3
MTWTKIALVPEGHSKPVGKYSPGIELQGQAAGSLVFLSGQVATDARGEMLHPGDAGGQAHVVFDRLAAVLAAAGLGLSDLVSLTIYVRDLSVNFAAVSAVRNARLGEPGPSSAFLGVAELVEDGCLVEIGGIAAAGVTLAHEPR